MRLVLIAFCILFCTTVYSQAQNAIQRIDSLNLLYDELEKTDLKAADSIANLAHKESLEIGYKSGEAGALSNLGRVQIRQGNNKKAVEYLFSALKIFENQKELQKGQRQASTLVRLAGALYFEGDFDRSLIYSQRAISLARENNFSDLLAIGYRVRGEVQRDRGQLDSSLYYFNEASKIFARNNNLTHLANIYVDIGVNYYYKKDYQQAIVFTRKFYELARKLNLQTDYAPGLHNIGEFHFLLRQYKDALTYLDSAQYYGEKFHQFTSLQDTYKVKAKLFTAIRLPDSASLYYEKLMAVKDSILNDTYKKELASLQTNMDLYRHEAENKILVKEKSIATLYRNLAIIGVLALISVLAIVLLRQRLRVQSQVKKKLQQEVDERTSEIMEQKATIEDVNLKLQLSLHRAKVDPHFVFNVLNSIQHLVLEKKPAEASDHLARLSRLTRYILEKSSLDEVTVKEEITMLEQYIRLEQLRLDNRFQYEIKCNAASNATLPAMLIQPYVENAIVHGFANQKRDNLVLRVLIMEDAGTITVRIEDNGGGRSRVPRYDGHQSIGSTLGQQRLEILSKLHHETYQLVIQDLSTDNEEERGTQVVLSIPQKVHQPAS
jgi:sensor histidine kinase YesM